MVGVLEGRVAIVTGAGHGLGREYALLLGAEGACVVVNDYDTAVDGGLVSTSAESSASLVASEIIAAGGTAIADCSDIAETNSAEGLLNKALERYGRLDVLINNAGVLRDRAITDMSDDDWDSVIRTHLRGHFVQIRAVARYWRDQHQKGERVRASIVTTSSHSGLIGRRHQPNYGAAKAGIAAMTTILAPELAEFDVRVNAVAPMARTRMALAAVGESLDDEAEHFRQMIAPPADADEFDEWDPANVAPLIVWLASERCPVTGGVFGVRGGTINRMVGWSEGPGIVKDSRWSFDELNEAMPKIWP